MTVSATEIAAAVRARATSAEAVTRAALARVAAGDPALNCFTAVRTEAALAEARAIDARIGRGENAGPLAGVPFAVKNLFDIAGLVTLAGSKINRDRPPAAHDAAAVGALRRAGAVLVGALNMDEYAFGFTTENTHYGPTRNPRDPTRSAGGSSGGSGAAVAAALVPLALGSDTNGSIRVPASFCGVFGLKPTYGRLSRRGVALLSASLDHVGPLARTVRDLAAAYDALQGHDVADPGSADLPPSPCVPQLQAGTRGLRVAMAGADFTRMAAPEVLAATERVAKALGADRVIALPETERARAASALITSAEAGNLHLDDLRRRPADFDPLTRDRLLAAALLPASAYLQAQRFRRWYRDRVRAAFRDLDVLVTPTTPLTAPPLGERQRVVAGVEVLTRLLIGLCTRPFSFIGLPALSVPVPVPGRLPAGVQLVAAPFDEAALFRAAAALEAEGIAAAPLPG